MYKETISKKNGGRNGFGWERKWRYRWGTISKEKCEMERNRRYLLFHTAHIIVLFSMWYCIGSFFGISADEG